MKTKVYWCQCGPRHGNFGDKLTPLLFDYFGISYAWAPPESADVVGIGSILQSVPEGFTGTIWSSGVICPSPRPIRFAAASTMAVRGKLTLSEIGGQASGSVVLGDGGLLVSLFRRAVTKRFKIGLIPHYAQLDDPVVKLLAEHPEVRLIDACAPPREVIHDLSQCEAVLSSSLHGLIVADALEVPNHWVRFPDTSELVIGGEFKFRDYYSVFGSDDPRPATLSGQEKLDDLLALFEGYSRPGIDGCISELLEAFGNAFGHHSRPNWRAAAQSILDRERQVLRRLAADTPVTSDRTVAASVTAAGSRGPQSGVPLAETRGRYPLETTELPVFFTGCLSLLRQMRDCGICHGDIREQNLRVHGSRPELINFGWRASDELSASSSGTSRHDCSAAWAEADARALGKILWEVCGNEDSLRTVARLMMHEDPAIAIRDLDLLQFLVDAVATRTDCSVEALLERIGRQDQKIEELKREKEFVDLQWRKVQYDVIAAELCEHVPPPNRFLIADGEQWRAELRCVDRAIPFPEKDGIYWGTPADDTHAVSELERLRSGEVAYFVLAQPMDWWRDAYPGFFRHLDESFDRCHESSRMTIYRVA